MTPEQDQPDEGDLLDHLDADPALIESLQAKLDAAEEKIANLEIALTTARRIGAALGILMVQRKITETQAFTLLTDLSQSRHRKLRDLADAVVESGELPA